MYDVVLLEKPSQTGLTKADVMDMYDSLNGEDAYPLEILNPNGGSAAMGFISVISAETIDYAFEGSGLYDFIARILDDMDLENPLGTYRFKGLRILLTR